MPLSIFTQEYSQKDKVLWYKIVQWYLRALLIKTPHTTGHTDRTGVKLAHQLTSKQLPSTQGWDFTGWKATERIPSHWHTLARAGICSGGPVTEASALDPRGHYRELRCLMGNGKHLSIYFWKTVWTHAEPEHI